MRLEVMIQVVLALAFVVSWFLLPIYGITGPGLAMVLTPVGYVVDFLGLRYLVVPPTIFAIWLFALTSSLIPIVWRSTRYPLYLSLLLAVLSMTMLTDTILFQWRYMTVRGYVIQPTPTGYIYVQLHHTPSLSLPFYILVIYLVLTLVNTVTRAKWLRFREWSIVEVYQTRGTMTAIKESLRRLGIPYEEFDDGIRVGDLIIKEVHGMITISRVGRNPMATDEIQGLSPEEAIAVVITHAVQYAFKTGSRVVEYEGE
ncbi:hypothetical protein [Caldivirga maquilingensis]|uniref:Uncharacterized protein n=1 Tax=Caldivirga maquilingensis (strain ATCC 700844 / DSM 13496 / JCM 10307 / IC-167) TaxID=397948 RepID=A8MA44_CALMQ|nr:hypothetical protein [Caldivirga maquilingensis]ABW00976.1 hypothetical protein Cmaq_0124 [Caldivirga maquilingensis IC-167]